MDNILFIDATNRPESRTRLLAERVLSKLTGKVSTIQLYETNIPEMTPAFSDWRTECCNTGNFEDAYFDFARQFTEADSIVIAAPYWDLSYPAKLKQYLEAVSINGITFHYTEEGYPVGHAKAKSLYFVTTAGGPIINEAICFGYVECLAQNMFGIKECIWFKAEGLDIWGNDVELILENAKEEIELFFS